MYEIFETIGATVVAVRDVSIVPTIGVVAAILVCALILVAEAVLATIFRRR